MNKFPFLMSKVSNGILTSGYHAEQFLIAVRTSRVDVLSQNLNYTWHSSRQPISKEIVI